MLSTKRKAVSRVKGVNPKLKTDHLEIGGHYLRHSLISDRYRRDLTLTLSSWRKDPQTAAKRLDDILESMDVDSQDWHICRQVKALVGKVPYLSGESCKTAALQKWWECEKQCAETNRKIRSGALADHAVLRRARELIYLTIGEFTNGKYREILERARHGPGVTLGTKDRTRTAPVYKSLREYTEPSVTDACVPLAIDLYARSPNRVLRELLRRTTADGRVVRSITKVSANRVAFVPKTSLTHRPIAIEPSVNLEFQLGVHSFLSEILYLKGVANVYSQEKNQQKAKEGSIDGSLATLDLSSASDTVAYELVKALLPESWFEFLDTLRCKNSSVEGTIVPLEKFSSMGNGFTFVLETLIFWAIARAVCDLNEVTPDVTVFGDDIIVPTCVYGPLTCALQELGFSVNLKKSFHTGHFRESCGADWSSGRLVTPIYLKKVYPRVTDAHRLINSLPDDEPSRALRAFLMEKIKEVRPLVFGLENENLSGCIFTSLDYLKGIGQAKWDPHIQNWKFRTLVEYGLTYSEDEETRCLSALMSGMNASTPRRGAVHTRVQWQSAGLRPVIS